MIFQELNIRNIYKEHFKSFHNKSGELMFWDKFSYIYLPIFIAIVLGLFCKIDDNLKDTITTGLSILTGLLFNLLILVITNIDLDKFNSHNNFEIMTRIDLIKQTFYNISYAIVTSLLSIMFLFLIDILSFSKDFKGLINLIFEVDLEKYLQSLLFIVFYFFLINTFIVLFMILKRIEKLFSARIKEEKENAQKNAQKNLDMWDNK